MTDVTEVQTWVREALDILKTKELPKIKKYPDVSLNKRIEHTLLKPTATPKEIDEFCKTAAFLNVHAVCVAPTNVKQVADFFREKRQSEGFMICEPRNEAQLFEFQDVKIVSVCGFPLGNSTINSKMNEAEEAVRNGALEIDFVPNLSNIELLDVVSIQNEVKLISKRAVVKVILETGLFDPRKTVYAAVAAICGGCWCLKTSTGFGSRGASVEDVQLLRSISNTPIKASGGIKTRKSSETLIAAGADLIGTSSSVEILKV